MPAYPDREMLASAESCLAAAAPLVAVAEARALSARIARAAAGEAFLLQGGDCAESFAEFGADKVRTAFNLLGEMAALIRAAGQDDVVTVARIAGQFAKPRSSNSETRGGVTLPAYRGDIVNAAAFDAAARAPDPMRMLEVHRQSRVTVDLLRAYAAAAYADEAAFARAARRRLGLAPDPGAAPGDPAHPPRVFTSHEALLLHYEEPLTRWDAASERWWALSGHMVWIGERTRDPAGAHVEYARGIANTIGVKCGPGLTPDDLMHLVERLDPENRLGRLVLIGRFGTEAVAERLPALMRATRQAGSAALWAIDPMHGNTRVAGGRKTRRVDDILAETDAFFAIARAEGVHPGGVHLETTGEEVTECIGGSAGLGEDDLDRRYLTHCDPRLNRSQALDVAAGIARLVMARAAAPLRAALAAASPIRGRPARSARRRAGASSPAGRRSLCRPSRRWRRRSRRARRSAGCSRSSIRRPGRSPASPT
jgi:3-deoxy-7-phosphoheptulonate synthase